MQLFSAETTIYFQKKNNNNNFAPQSIKNCPQKVIIIPLDQQFSVQKVFLCANETVLLSEIFSSLKLSNFSG